MSALKVKLDAATTDEQRINAYKEIADSAPTSDAEKRALFIAMSERLTPAGTENMRRFFAAVEANAAAQSAAKPVTYTVAAGDSVSKIASQFGISTQALYDANKDKIGKPYVKNGVTYMMIHPGQVLTIPGKTQAAASASPVASTDPAESPEASAIHAQMAQVNNQIAESDRMLSKYAEQRAAAVSQDVIQIIDQSISQTTYDKSVLEDVHRDLQQKYDEQKARDNRSRAAVATQAGATSSTAPTAVQSNFVPIAGTDSATVVEAFMNDTIENPMRATSDFMKELYGR